MKVKLTITEMDASRRTAKEDTIKEWLATTESDKHLTAGRARSILRLEVDELSHWNYIGLPVLVKMGNSWRAMKSTDRDGIWRYYYIEEIKE